MKKTALWKTNCGSDSREMFVRMSEYLKEEFQEIKSQVLAHLTNPESNFKESLSV
jgi:hypothetical protein